MAIIIFTAYRHYMYGILEYIWSIPTYHAEFKKLHEEVQVHLFYKSSIVYIS